MDNELEKKRMEMYRRSGDVVRALYGDPDLGKTLSSIAKRNSLPKEKKSILIDIVGDIILGLKPRNILEQNLVSAVSLTPETARLIVTELKPFLDKIPNENPGIPAANLESKERLLLRPDTVAGANANSGVVAGNTPPVEQKDTAAKPLTRDELMSALAGKRTMASDIEAVRRAREAAKNE